MWLCDADLLLSFAPAEREFNIREFSNPRFKMQLEFVKKGATHTTHTHTPVH